MGSYKEDKDQDFRTIFFLILVFLFILVFANDQENHNLDPAKFTSQDESVCGDALSHSNAVIFNTDRISDLHKYNKRPIHFTGINLFSFQNKLLCYNRKIAQSFLVIHRLKLSTGPFIHYKIYFHRCPIEDDSLPSLS